MGREVNIGQQEIYKLLQIEKKPLSRMQIAEQLNENCNKISELLRKMIEHNDIRFVEIDRFKAKKMFGKKATWRRMKLFYI